MQAYPCPLLGKSASAEQIAAAKQRLLQILATHLTHLVYYLQGMSNKPQNSDSTHTRRKLPGMFQSVYGASDLAEHSPVRGCMVIKPWGYAIWENMSAHSRRDVKASAIPTLISPFLFP